MRKEVDTLVIGAGAAGSVAAGLLATRSLDVMLVDRIGGTTLQSSGAVDVARPQSGRDSGYMDAIRQLSKNSAHHPYSRFDNDQLDKMPEALGLLKSLASKVDLQDKKDAKNLTVATQIGTIKQCALIQKSQAFDLSLIENGDSICVLGFSGLAGFDQKSVAKMLKWSVKSVLNKEVQVDFRQVSYGNKDRGWRSSIEMARFLDDKQNVDHFIKVLLDTIKTLGSKYKAFLIPPVLGIDNYHSLITKLTKEISLPIYELLAMPHSAAGLRLKSALNQGLENLGVNRIDGEAISSESHDGRVERVLVKAKDRVLDIRPKSIILATGRFFSGGFSRQGIRREKIFGLPLWYKTRLIEDAHIGALCEKSVLNEQPIFCCGLRVEEKLRPFNHTLELFAQNL